MDIFTVVHVAATKGASDLHLVASSPPLLRINGTLQPMTDMPPLTPDDINETFNQITSDEERASFQQYLEMDFSKQKNMPRFSASSSFTPPTVKGSSSLITSRELSVNWKTSLRPTNFGIVSAVRCN